MSDESRFWECANRSSDDECWLWSGLRDKDGYGKLASKHYRCGYVRAHRYSWEVFHGEKPSNMVLHTCDNPPCVNPNHLFSGSHRENMLDRVGKGRFIGEDMPISKMTKRMVSECRDRFSAGELMVDLATEFNISNSSMFAAISGITWKHVPGALGTKLYEGRRRPASKLQDVDVLEMRKIRAELGTPYHIIGSRFGVTYTTAYHAL